MYPLVFVALLGTIFGSFLNALLYRYNTGRSIASGRSKCMHCGHTLATADLVPILSYILLRGRCRYCHSRISAQYPLVEAAAGLLAVLVYLQHPDPLPFFITLGVWLTLLFIMVYDIRHQIIPWSASALLSTLALVALYLSGATPFSLIAGPVLAAPLLLLSLVSQGRWMGWGDGALELGLGWFLGLTLGLTAFVVAFWTGALVGIALAGLSKRYTMKSEVPFAPFLIWGAACAYFLHVDLFQTLPALFF
jgi:prepilin signal peptidase PulO-like enzyme (type II secretory pathway)